MLQKPARCAQVNCPLAKKGFGFAPTVGPRNAKILFVLEALEDGHVQFRCTVSVKSPEETTNLMSRLQTKIPQFQVSYVNLDTLL